MLSSGWKGSRDPTPDVLCPLIALHSQDTPLLPTRSSSVHLLSHCRNNAMISSVDFNDKCCSNRTVLVVFFLVIFSSACIWLYLELHREWIFNGSETYINLLVYSLVLYVIESWLYSTLLVKLYGNFKVFFFHIRRIVFFLQTPRSFNFALLHYRFRAFKNIYN